MRVAKHIFVLMTFDQLHLIKPILDALHTEGYTTPTPIQQQAIPVLLEGKDLLGCAQTGTGKTAAFAIPILQLMHKQRLEGKEQNKRYIRALVLTPTRELAIQIEESFSAYGRHCGFRHLTVFGGVSQNPQTDALHRGVDILVATPGRLLDLMDQGYINLKHIEYFVLDEADRMLDMGFVHDVKKIIAKLPLHRQSLFFSATMPKEIVSLANSILKNPVKVEVTPPSSTVDKIEQSLYFVGRKDKRLLLADILQDKTIKTALVFTRTKHGADKVAYDLHKKGIKSAAIHGNKSQNARQNALNSFKEGKIRVLVATDIAARGIDVDNLSHVFNFDLPNIAETYVHRIGRTARAGASGIAISFCDEEEKEYLYDIQKLIGKKIDIVDEHNYPLSKYVETAPPPRDRQQGPRKNNGQSRSGHGHSRSGQGQSRTSQGGCSGNRSAKKGFGKPKSGSR